MKELSIEEKAKRYDEAVRKAKETLDSLGDNYICNHLTKDDIKEMYANFFPELAESDDERIELLNYLYDVHDDDEERARWISIDKEVYVKEPVLAQKKDKSDPFKGYVVCCDHTLVPNVYERYMILGDIVSYNRWKPSDEQMVALDGICSYIRNKAEWEISQDTISDLYKLFEQLKKLK